MDRGEAPGLERLRRRCLRTSTPDYLLTLASVFWFTNSIGTSFRPYWEFAAGLVTRVERVDVPTAVALFPHDLSSPPRNWAERAYRVARFTRMPRDGHFAPTRNQTCSPRTLRLSRAISDIAAQGGSGGLCC